jgi:hypothetical protein
MSSDESLKSPHWPMPHYNLGPPDFIHALGAVAATFNSLESWLRALFITYTRMPEGAAAALFTRLDNQARIDLLKQCIEATDHSNEIKDALQHLFAGYAVCADNRNILMHAQTATVKFQRSPEKTQVLFFKPPKSTPLIANTYSPSLPRLRGIADSMNAFASFGRDLIIFIGETYNPNFYPPGTRPLRPHTLPKKPVVPRPLIPDRPSNPKGRRRPHRA